MPLVADSGSLKSRLARRQKPREVRIEDVVNIGPVLAVDLKRAGISSLERLLALGYIKAWKRLQRTAPQRDGTHSCLALAGAEKGVRWMALPEEVRKRAVAIAKGQINGRR